MTSPPRSPINYRRVRRTTAISPLDKNYRRLYSKDNDIVLPPNTPPPSLTREKKPNKMESKFSDYIQVNPTLNWNKRKFYTSKQNLLGYQPRISGSLSNLKTLDSGISHVLDDKSLDDLDLQNYQSKEERKSRFSTEVFRHSKASQDLLNLSSNLTKRPFNTSQLTKNSRITKQRRAKSYDFINFNCKSALNTGDQGCSTGPRTINCTGSPKSTKSADSKLKKCQNYDKIRRVTHAKKSNFTSNHLVDFSTYSHTPTCGTVTIGNRILQGPTHFSTEHCVDNVYENCQMYLPIFGQPNQADDSSLKAHKHRADNYSPVYSNYDEVKLFNKFKFNLPNLNLGKRLLSLDSAKI